MAALEHIIDTREPSEYSCAERTTATLASLAGGDSFVLVADHDPIGLQYMLQAEQPGVTSWELLEDGPPNWRVRIHKVSIVAGQ